MRTSRTIRERLAQRAHPKPELRVAESIEITEQGVTLDGTPLPYFVGTEIEVDHFAADRPQAAPLTMARFLARPGG